VQNSLILKACGAWEPLVEIPQAPSNKTDIIPFETMVNVRQTSTTHNYVKEMIEMRLKT